MANIPAFETSHLKAIPEFDGDTFTLSRFISSCELLLNHFYNRDPAQINCYQNNLLIHCLIGKLNGHAKLVVESQPVNSWAELKDVLTRNFSDSRNEENLIIDLTNMRQKQNETARCFYERCLSQLASLNTRCTLHEPVGSRITKIEQYTKLTLSIFLNGLFEPLRTNILNMRPQNLAEAMKFITERENNNAIFNRNRSTVHQNLNQKPKIAQRPIPPNSTSHFQNFTNFPNFNNFPAQNFQPNKFTRQPFQTNNIRNHSSQTKNVFSSNPNFRPTYKPTPMSGVSQNTFRPNTTNSRNTHFSNNNRNFFKPNGQNLNYIAEELHNTESQPDNSYFEESAYGLDYNEDDACLIPGNTESENEQVTYQTNDDTCENFLNQACSTDSR